MASGSKKVIYAALAGNALIAVTKFGASVYSGSSAMLTEAIHSLVDTGNQVLLLWGLKAGQKPPDPQFPFGHGKEIYFWSFVVSILIFALGAGISIYEGIHRVMHPTPLGDPTINYIVLAAAMLFEGSALFFATREFNKARGKLAPIQAIQQGKDPSMFVVVFEDSAAMAGLVIALFGVLLGQITGNPLFDGVASILIGCVLGAVAVFLAYETKSLLIGEAARPDLVQGITDLAQEHKAIGTVNEVLTMHMGPHFVLVCMSVDFIPECSADELEAVVTSMTITIKENYPDVDRVFIEAENWRQHAQRLKPNLSPTPGPEDAD